MKYDWQGVSDPASLQPGTYAVEITQAEEKQSSNGNMMWVLTLRALAFNCKLCHDRMMLPPNAGANISKAKLSALGFEDLNSVECGHLLGKRTWVTVSLTPASGQYSAKLDVDIKAKGSQCGYWSEKPGTVMEPVADQTPF